jgi:hypothetical protein
VGAILDIKICGIVVSTLRPLPHFGGFPRGQSDVLNLAIITGGVAMAAGRS